MVRYKTCRQIRLQENNTYLLQSADKKVGEATDINKVLHVYQIYNNLALGRTAHMLGDYKSDIALVGVYLMHIHSVIAQLTILYHIYM